MSRTFKLDKEPFRKGEVLYAKRSVTIAPGVTVLVGCNGTGKTTLLRFIKGQLKKAGVPFMEYDNLSEGGDNARQLALRQGKMDLLAMLACSSEGEQISTNIGNAAEKMGRFTQEHKDAKELWFLFDAIDSGLSIDNVLEVKELLFKAMIDYNPDKDIYIVVSANAYEMARGEKCLDVRGCRYREFKTYESFRKFIMKSKEAKIARYRDLSRS